MGQKKKGKAGSLTFSKSKIVIVHEIWKNRGVHKQLHENKNNIKSIRVERKNP
jgi:hypothetical protein